jgi:aminopeptidase N
MRPTRPLLLAALLAHAGCATTPTAAPPAPAAPAAQAPAAPAPAAAAPAPALSDDPHSASRPEQARVTDVALDLTADFQQRQLAGTATLTLDVQPGATELVLDTKDLTVEAVTTPEGAPLRFALGAVQEPAPLGQALTVQLPPGGAKAVVVRYRTSPGAGALQWLTPAQTAGKKKPYLFSQGQAILTRTWIPTQDSPGIRQTYAARITVPEGLRAVMSAEMLTPEGRPGPGKGTTTFEFRMPERIPPYLIALAVGDIAFQSTGARTGVYAEPSVVKGAASEFRDLETLVDAAESLYGPYRWGRYDVLVLPPSFPYGGMENPRLTFATPTVLAGDRSLVSLIAHELAHSWSGNLVTNATWNGFWLNEGFTTYFENRIMERAYGPERAAMGRLLGWRELQASLEARKGHPEETVLARDMTGKDDPEEAISDIAYEKGAAFLRTLEAAVGREKFDAYLRSYFDRNAFGSITSDAFEKDVRANLLGGDAALAQQVQLEQWLRAPGLPSNAVAPESDALAKAEAQAKAFAAGTRASRLDTKGWASQQWEHFLTSFPGKLTPAQLADLDRTFGLSRSGNSEVLFDWLTLAIAHRYPPAMPALEQFLTTQGRRKFLRPLYTDLMATDWGKPVARRIYAKARPGYHPVSATTLDTIVK